MKKALKKAITAVALVAILTGCYVEDPGVLQNGTRSFDVADFNRLELGSGFDVKVQQGNYFEVVARGDQRNLQDLRSRVSSGVLTIDYSNYANRKHQTYITITLPSLRSIEFGGGSYSTITGFTEQEIIVHLSGGSYCEMNINVEAMTIVLSGASSLTLDGKGQTVEGNLSGASVLKAFTFPHQTAKIIATGASHAKVQVETSLVANASGASVIVYQGNPSVDAHTSGGSSIYHE